MAIEQSVLETCERRGISRRRFMEFCGTMAATLALPTSYAQNIAAALGQKRKPVSGLARVSGLRRQHGIDAALAAPHH
jgi:Ni,Fe-hydrogenase I small subunit